MPLTSSCCCGDDPPRPDLECCDCVASSYSIALDMSWTSNTFDPANYGTVDASLSYSGFVVVADPTCYIYAPNGNATKRYNPSSSTGSITGANVSLAYTPIDPGFSCVSQSLSGATLNDPAGQAGSGCPGSNPNPHSFGALTCWHYYKPDGSSAFRWYHQTCFQSQDLCSDPFFGGKFGGLVNAYSAEQTSCHSPPSSGWFVQYGMITYQCDIPGCDITNYTSLSSSNQSFSLTIT